MRQRKARFPGEDTQPISKKELRGWYSYCVAAEVFAVSGVGSFLPVTLEQLARERGVLRSDGETSCINIPTRNLQERENAPCVIQLFGSTINTSSFALYTFSVAVFVQVLTLISISAIADHGNNRKRLLLTLSFTGATACMLFLVVSPGIYLVGSGLVIVSVTCLGTTFALLNSYLPLIVSNHLSVLVTDNETLQLHSINPEQDFGNDEEEYDLSENEDSHDRLHSRFRGSQKSMSQALKLSSKISSKGVGIGYAAAVLVQVLSIAILVTFSKVSPRHSKTTVPVRIVLFLVGTWWAAFTVPTALWLRHRPGPPLPIDMTSRRAQGWTLWISYIVFAWHSLWKTIKMATQLRQLFTFLVAWFLLSDAIATVSGAAILFAKTELQMKTEALAGLSITATISGIVGAYSWPVVGRMLGLQSKYVIVLCISLFEMIPLYGLLGFVPVVKSWGFGGLQQQWEIFPLGFILGFVMGGLNTYCRSVFGVLIPPNKEAAFFALYAVTDKGSSVIGPAIVGRIVDGTGSIRVAFWFLAVLILLPIPLIWLIDVQKGEHEALAMSANCYSSFIEDDLARDSSSDRRHSEEQCFLERAN
ncbi:putative MFS transporter family protein [Polychaeton citri CBS 116435]|uniref:Autophagy-related protein n=1 Tax=Polychaeton citri CBS 116435 TaxID=1314669 RepID=A0A9P4QDV2_9PEZI|nr:putative MFS transporter family protein [Polychaeton citri CBS 116435]